METKLLLVLLGLIVGISAQCNYTPTTASGPKAPGRICSGDLIFNDDFDFFDLGKWNHEISGTLSPTIYNNEFQAYGNSPSNSYSDSGHLVIRPTFENGESEIFSARITTEHTFRFKYGRVEIRAKMPLGDWLWPGIWMMPAFSVYGGWPASGEIDIMESRGNAWYEIGGNNIGIEQAASTTHWGPYPGLNGFMKTHYEKNARPGYDADYHNYGVEWTETYIKFTIDGEEVGTVYPPGGGFWEWGQFGNVPNPWANGGHMAPFDQEFFVILNLAIGGAYFPDVAINRPPKPWSDNQPWSEARTSFMNARGDWIPTWNMDVNWGDQHSLKVDYVKIWAL